MVLVWTNVLFILAQTLTPTWLPYASVSNEINIEPNENTATRQPAGATDTVFGTNEKQTVLCSPDVFA